MAFPIPVGRMKSADPLNVDHEPGATSRPEAYPSHIRELVPQPAALRIEDADQIRAIFATLSTAHAMGAVRVVHADKGANDNLASPAVAKLALGPRLLVSAEFWDNARQRPWLVELQGLYSLVRFQLEPDARLEGGRFLLPAELECVYRRSERRVSAPPSAKIRILRAQTPETWLERPLRDIGFRGLQFVTHPDDLFYPGERFCAAEVTWKHGPRIPLTAEVRHVSLSDLPNEGLCGVSVDADTGAQAEIWQQEISSLLHPDTTLASPAIAGQLWELYDVSGYFGLDGRKSSDFERYKLAFEISREKLARAPHLGCCVVREHRGRAEATISLLRCWSGAWLAYQGARRHDNSPLGLSGNSVLRDMFLHAYETVQQDTNLRWHVTYIRNDARFTRLSNYDFAESRNDGKNVAIVPFRALEVSCSQPVALSARQDIEIDTARSWELRDVCTALANRFPNPYLEAYDFVPDRMDLSKLKSAWSKSNLARERAIIVARRRGHPLAAAIVDLVENGIHLVGLLDSVHLISLHPDGVAHFPDLLRAAQHFFVAHGGQKFMLFEETGDPSYVHPFDARDLGEANQIFFASSLTSEYLDHVSFITAPRSRGENN